MRLLVSFLLIPVFVLGQMLPHSHAGTGVAESNGHAIRPHIHLRGHHHDGEDHHHDEDHGHHRDRHESDDSELGKAADCVSEWTDHDSDAVYLPESHWTASRAVAFQVDLSSMPLTHWDCAGSFAMRPVKQVASHPPDRNASPPIYLVTASLLL